MPETTEPEMTLPALALLVQAIEPIDHPGFDEATLRKTRELFAKADPSEAQAMWRALSSRLGNLPSHALTEYRERLEATDGPDHANAVYWFTWGVWHQHVEGTTWEVPSS